MLSRCRSLLSMQDPCSGFLPSLVRDALHAPPPRKSRETRKFSKAQQNVYWTPQRSELRKIAEIAEIPPLQPEVQEVPKPGKAQQKQAPEATLIFMQKPAETCPNPGGGRRSG